MSITIQAALKRWNPGRWFPVLLVLCGAARVQAQSIPVEPALIRLKPASQCATDPVLLRDIAEVLDDDSRRRSQLLNMDLAELGDQSTVTLNQQYICLRLQLAGFDKNALFISGAEQVVVTRPVVTELTDLGIEQTVHQSLARQFDVPAEDLHVKLLNPIAGKSLPQVDGPLQIELVPPTQLPLGRTQLTIRVLQGEQILAARSAPFEIARRQRVVVGMTSLDRSQVVTAGHVREEIRFVDHAVDQLQASQVLGLQVLQPIRPGEVITLRHLKEAAEKESPVLIHLRDSVRVTARKGNLTVVVPVAEALQDGRLGQLIRLRNLETSRTITGRVIGKGEVEVPLQ